MSAAPMGKGEIEARLTGLSREHGAWLCDIALPHGLSTNPGLEVPQTRFRRIVQIVADLAGKRLADCRILDLGCLEGQLSLELARQGARVVGVDIRAANIAKARFLAEAWGVLGLGFAEDDARNVCVESHGRFDAIVCSGLLYHLTARDALALLRTMHEMAERLVVIDTHVALEAAERVRDGEAVRWGSSFVEHRPGATAEEKERDRLASLDNETSFLLTRPSLVNALADAGFTSVHECFVPVHLSRGGPSNRCTFACVKGPPVANLTLPLAEGAPARFSEGQLTYAERPGALDRLRRAWAKRRRGR